MEAVVINMKEVEMKTDNEKENPKPEVKEDSESENIFVITGFGKEGSLFGTQ